MSKKLAIWVVTGAIAMMAVLALAIPAPAVNKNVSNDDLAKLQSSGALVVDVRTPSEYAGGHIAGATNVPVDQLSAVVPTWNKSQPIVVYCATGARSANAAAYLSGQGFTRIYNLEKGLASWTGQLTAGQGSGAVPSGPGVVKTAGRPVFIDFASST